jgi:hypothetical protein
MLELPLRVGGDVDTMEPVEGGFYILHREK